MKDYKSKDPDQITENIDICEFDKSKDGIIQEFHFNAKLKPRTCTWILTNVGDKKNNEDSEANTLFETCMEALDYGLKFKLKKSEWHELDSGNYTMLDKQGEGCGIGIGIQKTCEDKKCRKRDHHLIYYQINVNPSSCAPDLTEPDFHEFIDELGEKLAKNKESIDIRLELKPIAISYRYSTRELKDLLGLIKDFKPEHDNLTQDRRTAFVKYHICSDCHKDKNQVIEFGTYQIYDDPDEEEGLGAPNCICSCDEDEMSELIYGFRQRLNQNNESINGGKVSDRWD